MFVWGFISSVWRECRMFRYLFPCIFLSGQRILAVFELKMFCLLWFRTFLL